MIFNNSKGPPTIIIQGQSCHLIDIMLPVFDSAPMFAQLYIYDTENEIQNRIEGSR